MENSELKRQLMMRDNHVELLMKENDRLSKMQMENKEKIEVITAEKQQLEAEVSRLRKSREDTFEYPSPSPKRTAGSEWEEYVSFK